MDLNLAIFIPLHTPLTRMDVGFAGFLRDDYLAMSICSTYPFTFKVVSRYACASLCWYRLLRRFVNFFFLIGHLISIASPGCWLLG